MELNYPSVDNTYVTVHKSLIPNVTKQHTIGTWNARSMNIGKLEIVKKEMENVGIDILGISELKWTGKGHFS
jgi:hypothetical protein